MVYVPTEWALKSFYTKKSFLDSDAEVELRLRLDNISASFGLVFKAETGADAVVQDVDSHPVFFKATFVVAAAYTPTSPKVSLLGPHGQSNLLFRHQEHVKVFLTGLAQITPRSFCLHETSDYRLNRRDFDMVKLGLAGFDNKSAQMASIPMAATLEQLWNTGEYSDFTVVAGFKEFRVHRSVVCPRSAFFRAACKPGFREGETRRIVLEEDETTIGTLLTELYGVENGITGSIFTTFALKAEMEKEFILATLLKLWIASDKYNLDLIKTRVVQAMADRLEMVVDPLTIVSLAGDINDKCPEDDGGLRAMIVDCVYGHFRAIREDVNAYAEYKRHDFIVDALNDRFIELEEKVNSSSLPTPPLSPQKPRKSSRLASRGSNSNV